MTFTHTCLFFYLAEVPALPVVLKNRIWKKIYSELKNWNFEEKMSNFFNFKPCYPQGTQGFTPKI